MNHLSEQVQIARGSFLEEEPQHLDTSEPVRMLMDPKFELSFSRRSVIPVLFVGVNHLPLCASLVFETPA